MEGKKNSSTRMDDTTRRMESLEEPAKGLEVDIKTLHERGDKSEFR